MSLKLIEYFNQQPRLGALSTAGTDGAVNSAVFGSIQMLDEKNVAMGLGQNRTLKNLQENPNAVFLIMQPGASAPEWKGVRVYLKMTECHTSGRKLDEVRAVVAAKVGQETANNMIKAAVTFEVQEIRPLAEFGQSWEASIQ
jgi:hypothetical protein